VRFLTDRLGRLALLILLPLALAGCGINTIPTKQQTALARWADVQNEYQRRSDLIPNLVATVQGYAQQEKSVLTAVTEARANATHVSIDASTLTDPSKFQEFQQAQDRLSGVLGRLLSVTENYPDLKSNANFLALQSQLEGSENRIAVARRDYNEAVRDYNTELATFPGVLWAGTLYKSKKPMQTFQASTEAQTAPHVSFSTGASAAPPPAASSAPASVAPAQ
jgi:LemA protein